MSIELLLCTVTKRIDIWAPLEALAVPHYILLLIAFQYDRMGKWTEDIWTVDFWSTHNLPATCTYTLYRYSNLSETTIMGQRKEKIFLHHHAGLEPQATQFLVKHHSWPHIQLLHNNIPYSADYLEWNLTKQEQYISLHVLTLE